MKWFSKKTTRLVVAVIAIASTTSCGVLVGLDGYDVIDCTAPGNSTSVSCTASTNDGSPSPNDDGSPTTNDTGTNDGDPTINPDGSPIDETDAGPPNPIYVVSKQSLWKLDVITKDVTLLYNVDKCDGDFEALGMASNGTFFVGTGGLYPALASVVFDDAGTPSCANIVKKDFQKALTFVGPGVLGNTTNETFVGYDDKDYLRVSTQTGMIQIVTLDVLTSGGKAPTDLAAHGEIGYLAMKRDIDCKDYDCLFQTNLKTGAVTGKLGDFPERDILGVAYVRGKVYGFAKSGKIYVVRLSPAFAIIDTITPFPSREWGPATSALE